MPASQRQLVHELARHYNIPTCSYGNEPKRHIDLFRLPNSVAPLVKLSQVRPTLPTLHLLAQDSRKNCR